MAGSSPRTPALHPGAVQGLGEKEQSPAEETQQQSEAEGEYSFSATPSTINSMSSSGSNLPSTSTAVGRFFRWVILGLRSCVNSKTKRILTISSVVSLCFVIGTIIYIYTAHARQLQRQLRLWVVHTGQVQTNI